MPPNGTNLTITNPLVLYRSLIATNRIQPDPAQHRLALQLQKLYERLIEYEPTVEYSERLKRISRAVGASHASPLPHEKPTIGTRGIWTSLLAQKEKRDSMALTRVLTSHEAAMQLQSPRGLMLHGEVGTGKSMLIDLFADCLPHSKKRRWHFNTFMLDAFARLEQLRKARARVDGSGAADEYSLLWLARDLVEKSPILFLDEFQLPDRAASKILSNLMTSFFQLGGVLIATSNRMPEELAKAAGIEFARPVSRLSRLGWSLGMRGMVGRDDGPGQRGEFAQFLEVLRARCEVWEMEGKKDYRRLSGSDWVSTRSVPSGDIPTSPNEQPAIERNPQTEDTDNALPKHYLLTPSTSATPSEITAHNNSLDATLHTLTNTPTNQPIPWQPATLSVYGRQLTIPTQHSGTALLPFTSLCSAPLGPADYITLASTYHTLIITDIPILTTSLKNDARRLITLLDAAYEARCRLLVTAVAGPDALFFPAAPGNGVAAGDGSADPTLSETFSEVVQDLTQPFRPNTAPTPALPLEALEDDPPVPLRGGRDRLGDARAMDFTDVRGLTGEDERFAVKRAESRLWEMCSARWWDRAGDAAETTSGLDQAARWWRPLAVEARHWEGAGAAGGSTASSQVRLSELEAGKDPVTPTAGSTGGLADGSSPFRTTSDAPPRIEWTHVWGTVRWGKRAGTWGKGVQGLEERRKGRESKEDRD